MDNPIRDMVDNILSNKEAEALSNFEAAIANKLSDSLDAKKQEIAAGLGESTVTDKIIKAAEFVGDLVTGEFAKKMMQKKDDKKEEPPAQSPQKKDDTQSPQQTQPKK